MKKYSFKKLIVPGIYFVSVMAVIGCITLTITGINKYLEEKKDFKYSVNGLIDKKIVIFNLFKGMKIKLRIIHLKS